MFRRINLIAALSIFTMITGFWACVDLEFDQPPVGDLPALTPNATIAELKSKHAIGSTAAEITDDLVVAGIVVADDRSGNFYKNIVVQDATGGIAVRMDAAGLYNDFPVGSKVAIRCQGLYVGDYNGLYQLNGTPDAEIEEVLIPEHVVRIVDDGSYVAQPRVLTITDLANPATLDETLNTLVKFENVQFASADTALTYADAVNRFSANRDVQDCNGETIILRSSGYADFAANITPSGNGTLTAIVSVFGTTRQLIIRDPSDVNFANARCTGGSGSGDIIDIKDVRDLFNSGTTTGPANSKIKGVVISDRSTANVDGRNIYLQDATGGIVVRFAATHTFNLGDLVEVNVAGQELSEFNGLLQINTANERALSVGVGTLPTPRTATVAEINANKEAWESTLVKVVDATLTGGATYSGTRQVVDATGSVVLFTRTQATFASEAMPTGTVSIIAIVSEFNVPQLVIRGTGDVSGGGGTGGDPVLMSTADLRALFTGTTTTAPTLRKIKGIVISDRTNVNWATKNLVIQDGNAGIVVRFTADHTFNLGDEIEVNVSSQELSEFNGLLQVNNVPNANAVLVGPATLPAPRSATIAEIVANAEAWESTLVKISNATIVEGGTYSGSKTLNDGTGTIVLFTRSQATFAGSNVPTGTVNIVAVVSQFNDPQVIIRNLSDINP